MSIYLNLIKDDENNEWIHYKEDSYPTRQLQVSTQSYEGDARHLFATASEFDRDLARPIALFGNIGAFDKDSIILDQWRVEEERGKRLLESMVRCGDSYKISYIGNVLKEIVKALLRYVIGIHNQGMYAETFGSRNVYISSRDEASFIHIRKYQHVTKENTPARELHDFQCLHGIITFLFEGYDLPEDMHHFMKMLIDPQIKNRAALLKVHVALQNPSEYKDTISSLFLHKHHLSLIDSRDYIQAINKLDSKYKYWNRNINSNSLLSLMLGAENYDTDRAKNLLRFLRNVIAHLGKELHSQAQTIQYDDLSFVILDSFPTFIADFQEELHKNDQTYYQK